MRPMARPAPRRHNGHGVVAAAFAARAPDRRPDVELERALRAKPPVDFTPRARNGFPAPPALLRLAGGRGATHLKIHQLSSA